MALYDSPDRDAPIDRLARPFQVFAQYKLAGSLMLVGFAVLGLVWANSPWAASYHHLLETKLMVGTEAIGLRKSIHHWINDGLMGIFFFVIGLEIKREVLVGKLSEPRKAMLPVAAAIGGMAVPALVFIGLNLGGAGQHGWGIPMATDIAFCLGILMLLGDRVSPSIKVFLTAVAIVDDIGAILVIALFYTGSLSLWALAGGGLIIGISALANAAGMRNSVAYFILGTLGWFAFVKSGVHATLAAVLMAFTIPSRTRLDRREFLARLEGLTGAFRETLSDSRERLLSVQQQHLVDNLNRVVERSTSPLQRLEHALMPVVTFVALPIFALANAGVTLEGNILQALTHPVALGIIGGLFIGKQVGVLGASWVAVKLGWADLPTGSSWRHIWGVGLLAGVGFTMSLFINDLAFLEPQLRTVGKMAILTASTITAVAGYTVLRTAPPVDSTSETEGSP